MPMKISDESPKKHISKRKAEQLIVTAVSDAAPSFSLRMAQYNASGEKKDFSPIALKKEAQRRLFNALKTIIPDLKKEEVHIIATGLQSPQPSKDPIYSQE